MEPEVDPERELTDPYVIDAPFPHVPPGPGVRTGVDMETGSLLAREYFDPGCSPLSSHTMCVRSIFWYSEIDPVSESIRAIAARCRARASASRDAVRPVVVLGGRVCLHKHKPERHTYRRTGEWNQCPLCQPERHTYRRTGENPGNCGDK